MDTPIEDEFPLLDIRPDNLWDNEHAYGITVPLNPDTANFIKGIDKDGRLLTDYSTVTANGALLRTLIASIDKQTGEFSLTEHMENCGMRTRPSISEFIGPSLTDAYKLLRQLSSIDIPKSLEIGLRQWIHDYASIRREESIIEMTRAEIQVRRLTEIYDQTFPESQNEHES